MKLSEIKLNGIYAIVPSWHYNGKDSRDPDKVRENDVVKATVLSLDKYEYEPSNRKNNAGSFIKAQPGNRSVGVLVTAVDEKGQDVFWTSRLADVVAEWSVLEPRWKAISTKEDEEKRKREEEQNRERAIRKQVEEEVERSRNSITTTAKELLGEQTTVEVSTQGYGLDYRATVTISIREFERLMEFAYEGKDSVL